MMILGTNSGAKVVLVIDGTNASLMPSVFNGEAITAYVLTPQQEAAYAALSANRGGTLFDGTTFTALPAPVPSTEGQTKAVLKSQLNDAIASGDQTAINAATAALLNAL